MGRGRCFLWSVHVGSVLALSPRPTVCGQPGGVPGVGAAVAEQSGLSFLAVHTCADSRSAQGSGVLHGTCRQGLRGCRAQSCGVLGPGISCSHDGAVTAVLLRWCAGTARAGCAGVCSRQALGLEQNRIIIWGWLFQRGGCPGGFDAEGTRSFPIPSKAGWARAPCSCRSVPSERRVALCGLGQGHASARQLLGKPRPRA